MEYSIIAPVVVGVITLVTTIIATMTATYFSFVTKITSKVADVDSRVAKVEVRSDVFWMVLEPQLANILHSPDHQRRDELVARMVNGELTTKEKVELSGLMEDCLKDCADNQKMAAAFMLARVKSEIARDALK